MKTKLHSIHIIPGLKSNTDKIKQLSGATSELLVNPVRISGVDCCLFCCEGLVSTAVLTQLVLHPLMEIDIKNVSAKPPSRAM